MTTSRICLLAGSLYGASGVASGAWGAHGLTAFVGHTNTAPWDTAVLYQLVHAVALLCVGILSHLKPSRVLTSAGWLMITGVVLFSGSLYSLVLGAPSWLGPVTPLGGVALISAWAAVIIAAWRTH